MALDPGPDGDVTFGVSRNRDGNCDLEDVSHDLFTRIWNDLDSRPGFHRPLPTLWCSLQPFSVAEFAQGIGRRGDGQRRELVSNGAAGSHAPHYAGAARRLDLYLSYY